MSFIKSMTDIKFYRSIINQSVWKSLLYALVLALVIYTIGVVSFVSKIDKFIETGAVELISVMPDFSIANGQLSVDIEQPYEYRNDGNLFILDTGNTVDVSKYADTKTTFILQKDDFTVINMGEVKTIKYTEVMDKLNIQTLDKAFILKSLPMVSSVIKKYATIIAILGFGFWLVFFKIWSILLLSLIALIVNSAKDAKLSYKNLFNISVYAITLSWVIKTLYQLVGFTFFFHWPLYQIIYWAVAITYLVKVIGDIRNSQIEIAGADGVTMTPPVHEEIETITPTPPTQPVQEDVEIITPGEGKEEPSIEESADDEGTPKPPIE